MSGIKQLLAAGLVATASAANLRSGEAASSTALRSEIDALAQKYNCADGEKGLEAIIDEITIKNREETTSLNNKCVSDLASYVTAMDTSIQNANDKEVTDLKDADDVRVAADLKVTNTHNDLVTSHVGLTATAQSNADQALSEYNTQNALFNGNGGQKSVYEVEQALLVANRESAADDYKEAMSSAANALSTGKSSEDKSRNDKITTAGEVKTTDDGICGSSLAGRNNIVSQDTLIIGELKELETELNSLKSTARDVSVTAASTTQQTQFLETANTLRAKVHANYDQLKSQKGSESGEWTKVCNAAYSSYGAELTRQNGIATSLRESTDETHGDVYNTEKAAADLEYQKVFDYHAGEVQQATATASADLSDYNTKNDEYNTRSNTLDSVTVSVNSRRSSAKSAATIERTQYSNEKSRIITKATTFKDGVIAEASTLMQQEKSVCDAANNKRLTFLDSDQKVIDELTPLLAKLSTCSGPIALLEVDSKMDAECAMNELNLLEIFNAKSPEERRANQASTTTGSFAEWKKRLSDEIADSNGIHDRCTAKAQAAYDFTKKEALDLHKKETDEATKDAKDAIQGVDDELARVEKGLDGEMTDAQTPYDTAKSLNDAAKIVTDASAVAESIARATEESLVSAAKNKQTGKVEVSHAKRVNAIQADNDTADTRDADAKADHDNKMSVQTAKCDAEAKLLAKEAAALDEVISKMQGLKLANKGLSLTDVTNLGQDIKRMEDDLAAETASAAADNTVCLGNAVTLQDTTVSNANGAYTAAEEILVSANVASTGAAEATKSSQAVAHNARETTNDSNYAAALKLFNTKTSNNNNMAKTLEVAEDVEKDEVASSNEDLDNTRTRLQGEEDATAETKRQEATATRTAATGKELALRIAKDTECKDSNTVLADEKNTLQQTKSQIEKLKTVADATTGAAADRS